MGFTDAELADHPTIFRPDLLKANALSSRVRQQGWPGMTFLLAVSGDRIINGRARKSCALRADRCADLVGRQRWMAPSVDPRKPESGGTNFSTTFRSTHGGRRYACEQRQAASFRKTHYFSPRVGGRVSNLNLNAPGG